MALGLHPTRRSIPVLAKDIHLGGVYVAKVTGKLTSVRVENIVERLFYGKRAQTHYLCVNLTTGRPITVRFCQRFRSAVKS